MMSVGSLAEKLKNNDIIIPSHQRMFVWSLKQQEVFIQSLMNGFPCPSLLMYEEGRKALSLEDGSQRLRTIVRYTNDQFGLSMDGFHNKKYSEMNISEKRQFNDRQLAVVIYSNADEKQRIEIFDRFQSGSPLKAGERLNSLSNTPLVAFTIKTLLTPGEVFYKRATSVWGERTAGDEVKDKRYEGLLNAVAIIAGCAHGPSAISKKYESDIRPILYNSIDEDKVFRVLDMLLSIYEDTNLHMENRGKIVMNAQWKVGNFTGYIINSLYRYPDDWPRLRVGWINFLVKYRTDKSVLKEILHQKLSSARSWSENRWNDGYKNVFEDAKPDGSYLTDDNSDSDDTDE